MSPTTSLPLLAPVAAVVTLVQLAAGATLVAWLVDVMSRVGRGFRGTTSLICAAVVAVALLICWALPDPHTLVAGGSASAFATAVHWTIGLDVLLVVDAVFAVVGTDAARHVVGCLTWLAGLVALVFLAGTFAPAPGGEVAAAVTFVSGALLCGSALAGMLLGHWYLIAPDLTFRPLRLAVYLVFGAVALAAVAVAAGVATAAPAARTALTQGASALMFWLLVVGAGLVFTPAVNGLTLYFARIRANQPATAMLYVLIISALMGVVPATLVMLQTGAML